LSLNFQMYSSNSILVVSPNEKTDILSDCFDLPIFALGYESRCTYFFEKSTVNQQTAIVLELPIQDEDLHLKNKKIYTDKNVTPFNFRPEELLCFLRERIHSLKKNQVTILLDISSFPRLYIAQILHSFYLITSSDIQIDITICYTPAVYFPPKEDGPIVSAGPVLRELAGWPDDPNLPIGCVIGLGHEDGKALGIIEYIEPNKVWCLTPIGKDKRYLQSVGKASEGLKNLDSVVSISYLISKPYKTYKELNSLISSLVESNRMVLVPFGPKIIFAISTIVTLQHLPNLSLWRVSSESNSALVDSEASGENCYIDVSFRSRDCDPLVI